MKLDKLDFVRATYWLGAIVDALAAVQLLTPAGSTILGTRGLRPPGMAAAQPAIMAAVLMLAWSALLIWAHLRTRERRAVLAITLAIVLVLAAVNVGLGLMGAIAWSELVLPLTLQAILSAMFGASIVIARRAAIERGVA
jgi:heme A synthase